MTNLIKININISQYINKVSWNKGADYGKTYGQNIWRWQQIYKCC